MPIKTLLVYTSYICLHLVLVDIDQRTRGDFIQMNTNCSDFNSEV